MKIVQGPRQGPPQLGLYSPAEIDIIRWQIRRQAERAMKAAKWSGRRMHPRAAKLRLLARLQARRGGLAQARD